MSSKDKICNTDNHEAEVFPAELAILPEHTAMTAIKKIKFDSYTASTIRSPDLLKEILTQANEIKKGDLSQIERFLYAQAIALDAMFDRMLAQIAGADYATKIQLFGTLALKAQAQCRATLATLAHIKNPDQITFIKQNIQQQNNAINQQINTSQAKNPEKPEKITNELLRGAQHETLGFRGTGKTIPLNPAVETVDAIDRSKIT